jgi:predicted nucleic-acid-binding protein
VIAVDTNVLARLILQDDAAQHARAHQLFLDHAGEAGAIWVSDMVLIELVWVLTRAAGRSRADVVVALQAITDNTTLRLESPRAIREATRLYQAGPADFADCLLSVQAREAGADQIHTFDRKMRGLPGITLL